MPTFTVRFGGEPGRAVEVDGRAITLRVEMDGEYFQFIQAVVSGQELRGRVEESGVDLSAFWTCIAQGAIQPISVAVREGAIPLAKPTDGYQVFPDVGAALRNAHSSGSATTLPREGALIGEFER